MVYFKVKLGSRMGYIFSGGGGGGGGQGVLSSFIHTYARAQHLPFIPKKYQEFQAPPKNI